MFWSCEVWIFPDKDGKRACQRNHKPKLNSLPGYARILSVELHDLEVPRTMGSD